MAYVPFDTSGLLDAAQEESSLSSISSFSSPPCRWCGRPEEAHAPWPQVCGRYEVKPAGETARPQPPEALEDDALLTTWTSLLRRYDRLYAECEIATRDGASAEVLSELHRRYFAIGQRLAAMDPLEDGEDQPLQEVA